MAELAPLSHRVLAPTTLPAVEHPDLAVIRPATVDDLDALITLVHAAEAVDHPTWASPRDEVEDLIVGPTINAAEDTLIAFDGDGRAVAYSTVFPASGVETRVQMYVFGTTHPELRGRGIATQMLAWGQARATERLSMRDEALPAWITMYTQERTTDAISLGEQAGFSVERYFHTMDRDLQEPVSTVAIPEDVEIVPFTQELTEETRVARNDAFRDHWGSQPTSREKWARFVTGDIFREDLSVVARERASGRVVAFAMQSVNEQDTELQGYRAAYIDLLGVVRDRRGEKLAPALMAEALLRARADALARVTLDVDSSSPTGANALYERMGFTATDVEVALIIEF